MAHSPSYELLTPATVPAYIASQPQLAERVEPASLVVHEVGDGNLNLVFLCRDAYGRGVCLKQALPYVRLVGADWPLTPERATAEARAYEVGSRLAPEFIPAFYGFDAGRFIVAMEALSDWSVWRTALNAGQMHPNAGADMGRYVARLAFGTSVFGLDAQTVKVRLAEAINPELCQITEDLVFTEPYLDHPHNSYVAELADVVERLRTDDRLTTAVQALKYAFMSRGEALIHGDLHTGSVMVSPDPSLPAARAIDPEFCYYGPVGFDLGALFGNYLIARVRADVLGRPRPFRDWLRALPASTWSAFEAEMRRQWPARVERWLSDHFLDDWLRQVFSDAAGFGGCKAIRRIVGLAKVSDIQSLEGAAHVQAARAVLLTARRWIVERGTLSGPAELITLTDASLSEALTAPARG